MSVTISGSTGITLPDNGSLSTSVAGAMVIDSAGIVTKPLQPAFNVTSNTNQINISGTQTVLFQTEVFDQNNDFSGNTFTAPVTGKYFLNTILRLDNLDSASSYYRLYMQTSNEIYKTIWTMSRMSGDLTYWTLQNTVFADMDAGDTVYITTQQSGGSPQADISGGQAYFQGYLVC